ncbi:MAG: hypothetical protein AAF694_22170 [Bacteroidota bacterium]
MEKQIHQEFQRLKEELDKISSYANMMHRAEENVHQTTQLINQVSEKYESLVDLIWHEFNAELEALNILKENVLAETAKLKAEGDKPTVAALDPETRSAVALEVFERVNERFESLDEKLKTDQASLSEHVGQLGDAYKDLETRLQEKIDGQFQSLSDKVDQFGEEIKVGLIQVMDDLTEKEESAVAVPDLSNHPLNNGLGDDLKNRLQEIQEKINHSDSHLEQLIKGSLASSFSHFIDETKTALAPATPEIELTEVNTPDPEVMNRLVAVDQKLDSSDTLLQAVLEKLSQSDVNLQEVKEQLANKETDTSFMSAIASLKLALEDIKEGNALSDTQPDLTALTESLQDQLRNNLDTQFSRVDHKLVETKEEMSQTVGNLSESVRSLMADFSGRSDKLQKAIVSLETSGGNEGLETLKKVSRNQLQKLLDHETDLKKQKQLLGIITVISLVNLLLIIFLIVSMY